MPDGHRARSFLREHAEATPTVVSGDGPHVAIGERAEGIGRDRAAGSYFSAIGRPVSRGRIRPARVSDQQDMTTRNPASTTEKELTHSILFMTCFFAASSSPDPRKRTLDSRAPRAQRACLCMISAVAKRHERQTDQERLLPTPASIPSAVQGPAGFSDAQITPDA